MKLKYSKQKDIYLRCYTKNIPLTHTTDTMDVVFEDALPMEKMIDGVTFVAVAVRTDNTAELRWMRKDAFNWRKRVG